MAKTPKEDWKITIRYAKNVDENKDKTLQKIMQKLFDLYIMKSIQNIEKGK